ncbi:hypothetical protein QQ045_002798 [Rhodiola kirilowii]
MKKKNCDAEVVEISSKKSSSYNTTDLMEEGFGESPSNSQQMTIYDDKIGAYDVIELQARAILLLASHETERRMCKDARRVDEASNVQRLCSPMTGGLSMKRSLQRFLQKRKLRGQARLPY